MTSVLIAGVAVLDFIFRLEEMPRRAEKFRAKEAAVTGGGCAANAAVAAARLGGQAMLAARLGADEIGDLIVAGLTRDGVDCSLVRRFEGARSSFSSVFVDRNGERQIVNFRDMAISFDADWLKTMLEVRFDAALADTRWPQGAAAVLSEARKRGRPGVLDAEAPMDEAGDALRAASHVAFSAQGLRDFSGERDLGEGLARARRELGAWVCVTDGANGVSYLGTEQDGHVPAFPVEVVDTLGAGDVWHGAFALRLGEGSAEVEAIRFANAVAAIKCTRFGGRAGTPTRSEAEALMKEHA
jgi:sulfofructose kinase